MTLLLLVILLANFIQNWWAWICEVTEPKYVNLLFPTFVQSKHLNPPSGLLGSGGIMETKNLIPNKNMDLLETSSAGVVVRREDI